MLQFEFLSFVTIQVFGEIRFLCGKKLFAVKSLFEEKRCEEKTILVILFLAKSVFFCMIENICEKIILYKKK